MPKGILVLAPGFEEIEAITPVDLLRRASIEIVTVSTGSLDVQGNHNITVRADLSIDDLAMDSAWDFIILPGGMPGAKNLSDSPLVKQLVLNIHSKGGLVCAICAAPAVVLSPMGLLKGRNATCFPGYKDQLSDAVFSENRVVRDHNIITSRAAGTAAEFSHAIIEALTDTETAMRIHKSTLQK